MHNILILGGTGWLSGRIAERFIQDGAVATCLARGTRSAPAGATMVRGDRDRDDAYEEVAAQRWDHIVDISSRADHVAAAVEALGDRTKRWTYVSSVSVYLDDAAPGLDESGALHPPAQAGDVYEYGAQKVAAENIVRGLGDRALVVRPGLIVGAGDPTDRFGYWAAACLRAGGGRVLRPRAEGQKIQVIDVLDLAEFIVTTSATGLTVNAVGDERALSEVLEMVRRAVGHAGELVIADDEWLVERGVEYWAGDRSLPLWLPGKMTGFMTRSNERYYAAGGVLRPLHDTIADVAADESARGVWRDRKAGLTREDELALLEAFV